MTYTIKTSINAGFILVQGGEPIGPEALAQFDEAVASFKPQIRKISAAGSLLTIEVDLQALAKLPYDDQARWWMELRETVGKASERLSKSDS